MKNDQIPQSGLRQPAGIVSNLQAVPVGSSLGAMHEPGAYRRGYLALAFKWLLTLFALLLFSYERFSSSFRLQSSRLGLSLVVCRNILDTYSHG